MPPAFFFALQRAMWHVSCNLSYRLDVPAWHLPDGLKPAGRRYENEGFMTTPPSFVDSLLGSAAHFGAVNLKSASMAQLGRIALRLARRNPLVALAAVCVAGAVSYRRFKKSQAGQMPAQPAGVA
jgi:hypothetical protein